MKNIPLFPLNIVALPKEKIPLHIFEPRYKRMIKNSIKSGDPFGIVFQDKEGLKSIGCSVKIITVIKEYPTGEFDIIVSCRLLEHSNNIHTFVGALSKLLKKNGLMFIATLNKTLKSYAFAIIGAENVLQWLPIGTHDWDKFVKPEDLIKINKDNNLKLEKLDGMKFNLLTEQWSLSSDNSVNYITKFKKN